MIKQALRTAAVAAALGTLLGLAMPATSHAAAARVEGPEVGSDQTPPAGLWQSLADLWDGVVAAVFAGSEDDESGDGSGESTTGTPPDDGGNNSEDGGDGSPGHDPNG